MPARATLRRAGRVGRLVPASRSGVPMDTAYYLNLAFNGLVEGSIYALGALAITLVFGIARFPNS